jgi:hypothetical protein
MFVFVLVVADAPVNNKTEHTKDKRQQQQQQ